jgi:hypothetical protein
MKKVWQCWCCDHKIMDAVNVINCPKCGVNNKGEKDEAGRNGEGDRQLWYQRHNQQGELGDVARKYTI